MGKAPTIEDELESVQTSIWGADVVYFPVRHHSPACARHVESLIRSICPRAVLVEGPTAFESLLPVVLDARTSPPVAFYTTFVDRTRRLRAPSEDQPDFGPPRFSAYYPFAEYSPEWVALRTGAEIGATLRFIDLDYATQVVTERQSTARTGSARAQSLLDERHLTRSRYLRALATRSGCRDFDEMWDHLFESSAESIAPREFASRLAVYCWMARRECSADELDADATTAREQWMATCIREELRRPGSDSARPVLVVTGGFHTVALPGLVAVESARQDLPEFGSDEVQHYLIRYSFAQLDSLNGYGAGMPSPHYYQKIWENRMRSLPQALEDAATATIVDVGRLTRRRRLATAVSSADAIAALHQARLLAQMRGHPGPLREDLLDGIRSCFSKGGIAEEGAIVMALARETLAGQAIGAIPPEAAVPPIVSDFRRLTQELRLGGNDSTRRQVALELYRKVRHRHVSRFLHSLEFIGVPFGRLTAGPDFVRGTDVSRLIERWECLWTPRTEAALVDAAVLGSTIDEAALARLQENVAKLSTEGRGRDAAAAVEILIRACRMGLHAHCAELTQLIATSIAEDSSFSSVVRAAEQFVLLWQAREPLEAHHLTELPDLVKASLMRAAILAPTLSACAAEERDRSVDAMVAMRGLLATVSELVDADIYWAGLERLRVEPTCEPVIAGAAVGVLHGAGHVDLEEVARSARGYLNAVGLAWNRRVEFLRGLLRASREIAWQSAEVLRAVDRLLLEWSEEEFIEALPELRLAFADLTPRETDKVGAAVAQLHGTGGIGDLFTRELTHAEFERHRRISAAVISRMREDGLGNWLHLEGSP